MFGRAVALVVLAGSALAGCSAADGGRAAQEGTGRGPSVQGVGPSVQATAVCAAPKPTNSWMGGSSEGLPEDVRCLPHVADGDVLDAPPAAAEGTPLEGRSMTVHVTGETTGAEALALCRKLTAMGYVAGGAHDLSFLAVGGADAGQYTSMRGGQPCEKIR